MSLTVIPEHMTGIENAECIEQLLREFGISQQYSLQRLYGGGNNRLYKITVGDDSFLIKHYFQNFIDTRHRLNAEFNFSSFLWENGIRCIPRPLMKSEQAGMALYSFIAGDRQAAVTSEDIGSALEFLVNINSLRHTAAAQQLPNASESCFSIVEHVETVERRIGRLKQIGPADEIDNEAIRFVSGPLSERWQSCKTRICDKCQETHLHNSTSLSKDNRILSPSDFGFHNTLKTGSVHLSFLDFEYAGWDDPAKTIGDFFNQVSVPVPLTYVNTMIESIGALVSEKDVFTVRSKMLMPLYAIKWCCIVLNHFLPSGAARRTFASENVAQTKINQLNRAKEVLVLFDRMNKKIA